MFIAALFIIAKKWKSLKCPTTELLIILHVASHLYVMFGIGKPIDRK